MERKWAFPLVFTSVFSIILLMTSSNMGLIFSTTSISNFFAKLPPTIRSQQYSTSPSSSYLPRLVYLISGSRGDLEKLWRTLFALYHPRNYYILHLDRESPETERNELQRRVSDKDLFAKVGNVEMIVNANVVTYRGPTMVTTTLHAAALVLRRSNDWDWFINLSASDYPLMTQDDILQGFSSLPRNLNFVEHTSKLGWKETQRARPLIIDPGLYRKNKSDIIWLNEQRDVPTAFKLFTGSAWVGLSREFVEYCVWGWDNIPRLVLMYYSNFISSPESYFQTVICNVPKYAATVVNHDIHYIAWDNPPKQHPHILDAADYQRLIASNAPFARKFRDNDQLLDRIDVEILGRKNGSFTPGGWCQGHPICSDIGDINKVQPGPGLKRLTTLMDNIVRSKAFLQNQCKK